MTRVKKTLSLLSTLLLAPILFGIGADTPASAVVDFNDVVVYPGSACVPEVDWNGMNYWDGDASVTSTTSGANFICPILRPVTYSTDADYLSVSVYVHDGDSAYTTYVACTLAATDYYGGSYTSDYDDSYSVGSGDDALSLGISVGTSSKPRTFLRCNVPKKNGGESTIWSYSATFS